VREVEAAVESHDHQRLKQEIVLLIKGPKHLATFLIDRAMAEAPSGRRDLEFRNAERDCEIQATGAPESAFLTLPFRS